jgi:hypothetical protein
MSKEEKELVDWQTMLDRIEYFAWNISGDSALDALEAALNDTDSWLEDNETISEEDEKELKRRLELEVEELKEWERLEGLNKKEDFSYTEEDY